MSVLLLCLLLVGSRSLAFLFLLLFKLLNHFICQIHQRLPPALLYVRFHLFVLLENVDVFLDLSLDLLHGGLNIDQLLLLSKDDV